MAAVGDCPARSSHGVAGRVTEDLVRELETEAAQAQAKNGERDQYVRNNPDMSWSSTQMMDDALDRHFGEPEKAVWTILQLLRELGTQARPWIDAAAAGDGPGASELRLLASTR